MPKKNFRQSLIDKMATAVTQNNMTAGSINTAYLSAGCGQTVVCLHGAGAGGVTWYPSIAPLAKYFHVIAPDIVGFGESDKPDAPYDRPYFAAWLKDFIQKLGLSKVHLVGLSQGGAIALQFAHDYPDMIDKLVLVDTGGMTREKPPLLPFLSMLGMTLFPSALTNRFFSRYLLLSPANRDPDHASYSIEVLKRKDGKKFFTQGRGSAVSAMSEPFLGNIPHETLVIWGEDDRLFPIEQAMDAIKMLPKATLYQIKNAGHLPLMDQTDIFNHALIEFLNS